jgi:SAM-dependent methyltransferase
VVTSAAIPLSLEGAVSLVARAYRQCLPKHKYYVRAKLKTDPLTRELFDWLNEAGPLGNVLDAGCGRGQFSLFAAVTAQLTSLRGFDLDAEKIEAARQASDALNETAALMPRTFQAGDLRTFEFPLSNTVFAFDVLHYLSAEDQGLLVQRLSECLAPGGKLLIRETNQDGGFGAKVAAGFERVGKMLGINRGVTLVFREPGALEAELRGYGLQVEKRAPKGALRNVLLIAARGI